jgi:hypothetical protein
MNSTNELCESGSTLTLPLFDPPVLFVDHQHWWQLFVVIDCLVMQMHAPCLCECYYIEFSHMVSPRVSFFLHWQIDSNIKFPV